jgi:hypothetical protein
VSIGLLYGNKRKAWLHAASHTQKIQLNKKAPDIMSGASSLYVFAFGFLLFVLEACSVRRF